MAAYTALLLKCRVNSLPLRNVQNVKYSLRTCQFSTSKLLTKELGPVKFTASPAAKVSVEDTTGLYKHRSEYKIKKFIIITCVSVFLLYFCVFREENDLDEILSGNTTSASDEVELVNLKLKLNYCKKANLPTAQLIARIEEIEEKLYKPVFRK